MPSSDDHKDAGSFTNGILCEQHLGEQARIALFKCGSFYEQDKGAIRYAPSIAFPRKLQNRLNQRAARISILPFNLS
jgi:hypothetical protein